MKKQRIAVPSIGEGGLDGHRAGHFGPGDVFTCVDTEDGKIVNVYTIENQEHVQGGCLVPVNLLAENQVTSLIVDGIGFRPLMGFRHLGIEVYHDSEQQAIKPLIEDLLAGKLPRIIDDQVCGGSQ